MNIGPEEFRRIISASIWVFASVAAISYLFQAEFSRFIVFVAIPLGVVFILSNHRIGRSWLHAQRRRGKHLSRLVVMANKSAGRSIAKSLLATYQAGLLPVGVLPPPRNTQSRGGATYLKGLAAQLKRMNAQALLIAPTDSIDSKFVRDLSWSPQLSGVSLYLAPQLTEVTGPRTLLQGVPDLPYIHLESPELTEWAQFVKRVFDFFFALLALVVLSPFLVLIGVVVALTSRGGPLFVQWRVGEHGKRFRIIKFRTMRKGADLERSKLRKVTGQRVGTFKMKKDPRVTPFGRFLRRWSLDELPQLLNVLAGSMSVVGPRPHTFDDVARYAKGDELRLSIKPGLTGLQQVSGRSRLIWQDSVRADLRYIENWSFSGDLLLIARTVRVVVSGQGAY
jgi:exopolysaccharide biosynthesis polyprenyl glycosylphosphotransferase